MQQKYVWLGTTETERTEHHSVFNWDSSSYQPQALQSKQVFDLFV
jgi:hypothetical protein